MFNTYDFTFTNNEDNDYKIQLIMTYDSDDENNINFNNIKSSQDNITNEEFSLFLKNGKNFQIL